MIKYMDKEIYLEVLHEVENDESSSILKRGENIYIIKGNLFDRVLKILPPHLDGTKASVPLSTLYTVFFHKPTGGLTVVSKGASLLSKPASATLVRGMSLQELVGRSQHAVMGTPLAAECAYLTIGGRRMLVTQTQLRVEGVLGLPTPSGGTCGRYWSWGFPTLVRSATIPSEHFERCQERCPWSMWLSRWESGF